MTTLAARYLPTENSLLRNALLAIAGSLFVAGAAQVSIPFWPVPMTLQALAVLLVGGAYGARLGASTLVLYIAEGAAGLPVFSAGHAGLAYLLFGATTGYLIGFVLAAALMGFAAERGAIGSPVRMVVAALLAATVIDVTGAVWLWGFFAVAKGMVIGEAFTTAAAKGFGMFMVVDAAKAVIAGLGLSATWNARQD